MRIQSSALWSLRLFILILSSLTIVVFAVHPGTTAGVEGQTCAVKRAQMIRTMETQARDTGSALGHNHIDARVLEAWAQYHGMSLCRRICATSATRTAHCLCWQPIA
jgi:hypothetical protein